MYQLCVFQQSFIITMLKFRFVLLYTNRYPAAQTGSQSRLLCYYNTKNKARQFSQNYRAFTETLSCFME